MLACMRHGRVGMHASNMMMTRTAGMPMNPHFKPLRAAPYRLWDLGAAGEPNGVVPLGTIRRQSKERVVHLRYSEVSRMVAGCVQAACVV